MGYKPGPEFKKILAALKDAKLDGLVDDREGEVALLKKTFPL